jgi:osmotically-inducible protein OsmY
MSTCLMTAALAGFVLAGSACTSKAMDDTKKGAGAALDATRSGADKAIEATKQAGKETADVAKDVAQTTADVASAAGAAVTDGWITAKLKTKFADETVLNGRDINVDTFDHVVTLKGTVLSADARARAEVIASGTEGVARVVNELVVKQG